MTALSQPRYLNHLEYLLKHLHLLHHQCLHPPPDRDWETAIISCGSCQVGQFKTSSTLSVVDSEDSKLAHFLVVAGGAAGAFKGGAGGGGGGGVRTSYPSPTSVLRAQQLSISPGPYTITVGAGGAAGDSAWSRIKFSV